MRSTRRPAVLVAALAALGVLTPAEAAPPRAATEYQRLQAELNQLTDAYSKEFRRLDDVDDRLKTTSANLTAASARMRTLRERLRQRVRIAYRMGGTGFLGFLFEAKSLRELSLRTIVLERQATSDETLLLKLRRTNAELVRTRTRLKQQRTAHARTVAELKRRGSGLGSSFTRMQSLWTDLEKQAQSPDPAVAARAKTALSLIGGLPTRRLARNISARGRVVAMQRCPAGGPHAFSNDWGACRGYRCRRRHRGNDIFGPKGSPAVAVAPGRVSRFGNGGNAGLSIYFMSDDGVEYRYFHMSRFASSVGRRYSAGDVIGYVGNTGNARRTAPHIHFEVHPGGGAAINPYPSLIRVC